MTNEEKEKIRIKYEHLLEIKKEILKNKEEIEMLEQDPTVKRYLELKERLESDQDYDYFDVVHLSNEMILEKAIESVKVTNINNIYVYLATYQINLENDEEYPLDFVVSFDDPNADYSEYMSIESDEYAVEYQKKVTPNNRKEFEQNNIVLYPPKGVDSAQYYSKIRTMYFNTAIQYGCEKALEKVLYRRNMQQSFQNKDNN